MGKLHDRKTHRLMSAVSRSFRTFLDRGKAMGSRQRDSSALAGAGAGAASAASPRFSQ
jgi:hypothetical protein